MTEWMQTEAPSLADIDALAQAARAELPDAIQTAAQDVALIVTEVAPEEMLAEMRIEDPLELTGLYDGIPLPEKSVMDQPLGPDTIWLFRRAILEEWVDRGNVSLGALVAHVYVHELAHHMGWSDEDIASIDRWWE